MKVIILDREIELKNEMNSIEKIYDLIENIVDTEEYYFSHLNVDGKDVYTRMEDYICENLETIETIAIELFTIEEFIKEVLNTKLDYIYRAIPEINILANGFYNGPSNSNWNEIKNLFEGIEWIVETFQTINNNEKLNDVKKEYEDWNSYNQEMNSLVDILMELEEAIKNEDIILTGDLLSYEIIPKFEKLKLYLEKIMI